MSDFLGLTYDAINLANALEKQVDEDLKISQDQQYDKTIEDLQKEIKETDDEDRKDKLESRLTIFKGIHYKSDSLSERQNQNKVIGLIFKPQGDTNFLVHAVFWDSRFVFKNFIFPNAASSSFIPKAQGTPFKLPIGEGVTQTNLEDLKFQYWEANESQEPDKKVRLVFFGVGTLKLILAGASEVKISGASINYGYSTLGDTEHKPFPTLKIETNLRINADDEVPNVAIGIPCPTLWGNEKSVINALMNYIL